MKRPRLLPVLAAASALLLGTKLADLWLAMDIAPFAVAQAQSPAPPAQKVAATAPQAPGAPAGQAPAADAEPPATRVADRDPTQFSPQEVKLLQALSKRRDELDRRSGEIDQRAALLQAAEKRIDEKIAKLQAMEQAINASFKKQDQQDDAKLASLVKIYEAMKPQDAARIFEQLDLPVLLEVVERMKERKTAPIMAAMDPLKAKAVTLALAAHQPPPQLKTP